MMPDDCIDGGTANELRAKVIEAIRLKVACWPECQEENKYGTSCLCHAMAAAAVIQVIADMQREYFKGWGMVPTVTAFWRHVGAEPREIEESAAPSCKPKAEAGNDA
jgi:hypothetical protein